MNGDLGTVEPAMAGRQRRRSVEGVACKSARRVSVVKILAWDWELAERKYDTPLRLSSQTVHWTSQSVCWML